MHPMNRTLLALGIWVGLATALVAAPAAPPTRPMRIYGEVLVNNATPPDGETLVLKIGPTTLQVTTQKSCDGRTVYELLQRRPAALPATITFVSLGDRPLTGNMADIAWKEGDQKRQDVRINCANLPPDVTLTTLAATVAGETWTVTAQLALPPAERTAVAVKTVTVLVYARLKTPQAAATAGDTPGGQTVDRSLFPDLVFMGQQAVTGVAAPVTLSVTRALAPQEVRYLEVHVFATSQANIQGAAAVRAVVPVIQSGQL